MIALDTSVVVAALLTWHEQHARAARAVAAALEVDPVLPVHVLVETYAVLTRLPAPHRIAPQIAIELLTENFADVKLAQLPSRGVWPLLRRLGAQQLAGGISYDALIVEAAKEAGATRLLTLNARDYARLDVGIEVVTP